MSINNWAQQFPGASPSVHTNHTQDLQEAHAAQGWRGEDVALRPSCYHRQRCHEHYEVYREGTQTEESLRSDKISLFSYEHIQDSGVGLRTVHTHSPMTQKGFLANLSLPCHPRYLQQQPAAQILMKYSNPNTTIITNSYKPHTHTHTETQTHRSVTCTSV